MRLKLIAILVSALLTSCVTDASKKADLIDTKPKFNYLIKGGENWGVVQAFTSMGKTHVQFLDIDRANPVFLSKEGAEINFSRVGMYAVLPTAEKEFFIASSYGRAHVNATDAQISATPDNPSKSLELDKASLNTIQAKIDELSAEKKALEFKISEQEAAALLAKKQLGELQLVTHLLNDKSGNTFLGEDGTVINRVYFDDFATSVADSNIDDSAVVLDASNAASKVIVRGFTDSGSSSLVARNLAASRSANTKKFLVSRGVDSAKIRAFYRSSNNFLVPNSGELRRFNRRVEITYYFDGLGA